jgi:hypothetical protein
LIEEQPKFETNNNAIINLTNVEFIQVAFLLSPVLGLKLSPD